MRPGAPFAGTDSTGRGIGFALLHIGDTRVLIDPDGLHPRLVAAGFEDVAVVANRDAFCFRARRPLELTRRRRRRPHRARGGPE